ncbi:MAG: biotin--[Lactococcus sp.]|nr:biotin--[acetyl-CoA-carboxylase] ligase [Lactococcus sp.]
MTTSTAEIILNLLIDHENEWVSGQELAARLNLSRAAIWKAITKLSADGFTIETQRGPGKGYRYIPDEKMSAAGISHDLQHDIAVQVFDSLPSTNVYAKQGLVNGEVTEPTVIIANIQTRGTGHFGRVFDSPAQTGLYLSFALPITPEQQVVPSLLATAIAVAVGRTVKELFDIDLDFRWINNIYYQGQKVGGILTEAIVNFETQTYSALIVGIGLNLTNKQTELGYLTSQLAISRNQVAASLIDQFLSLYDTYQDGKFLDDYRAHFSDLDKNVQIQCAQKTFTGKVLRIDKAGRLVLKTAEGLQKLSAGETI